MPRGGYELNDLYALYAWWASGGWRCSQGEQRDMSYLPIFECGLLGFGIALVAIPLILKACQRGTLLQRAADLHHTNKGAVPRLGGLALAAAFVGVELFIVMFYPEERLDVPGRIVI